MDALPPIRRVPLYEEVVDRLRRLIALEDLKPGDRLPAERELAAHLGVSRTSVRQAVTVLRVMGVVSVRHGDGVYLVRPADDVIPPVDPSLLERRPGISEVSDVREALESQAARLAARRRTVADLERLRAAVSQMEDEVSRGGNGRHGDREFHAAVVGASHSPLLERLLGQIIDQISLASLDRSGQVWRSLVTHAEIVEAIGRADDEAAYQLMRNHLAVTGGVDGQSAGSADRVFHVDGIPLLRDAVDATPRVGGTSKPSRRD